MIYYYGNKIIYTSERSVFMKKIILKLAAKQNVKFLFRATTIAVITALICSILVTFTHLDIFQYILTFCGLCFLVLFSIYVVLDDISSLPNAENMKLPHILLSSYNLIYWTVIWTWFLIVARHTHIIIDILVLIISFPISVMISKYFRKK